MKNSFSISVQKPCLQKFEEFTPTQQGGFCASCQKEVIDFTLLSDEALIQHFNTTKDDTCGRFRKSQLKEYQTQTMPSNFISKSVGVLGFSLLALCAVSNVNAQETAHLNNSLTTEINSVENYTTSKAVIATKHTVTGTVLDEEDLPLPGVNVILKGTTEGVQTDFDGNFEFPKQLETGDILVFSYIGYGKKEYTITTNDPENINLTIKFDLSDIELMGEIVVGGAYKSKRNIFQKFISLFK